MIYSLEGFLDRVNSEDVNNLSNIKYKKYISILEKKTIIDTILNNIIKKDENNYSYYDPITEEITFNVIVLSSYLENVNFTGVDEENIIKIYDLIKNKIGFEYFYKLIGKDFIEFVDLYNLEKEYKMKDNNLEALVNRQLEEINNNIEIGISKIISSINDLVKTEGIEKIVKNIKKIFN